VVRRQQYILGAGGRMLLNGVSQALGAVLCVALASGNADVFGSAPAGAGAGADRAAAGGGGFFSGLGIDAPLDSGDAHTLARGISLTLVPFALAQWVVQLSAARHYMAESLSVP
jgi:hypothetical protein